MTTKICWKKPGIFPEDLTCLMLTSLAAVGIFLCGRTILYFIQSQKNRIASVSLMLSQKVFFQQVLLVFISAKDVVHLCGCAWHRLNLNMPGRIDLQRKLFCSMQLVSYTLHLNFFEIMTQMWIDDMIQFSDRWSGLDCGSHFCSWREVCYNLFKNWSVHGIVNCLMTLSKIHYLNAFSFPT